MPWTIIESFDIDNCVVDGIGDVVDVLGVEAHHCHPAVFHHVDVVFVDQMHALGLGQTGVRKHSDLVCYVLPGTRSILLLQSCTHLLSHCDHPFGY